MKSKEQKLLEAARALADQAQTWADLSNALFDPDEGLLAKAYRKRADREKFSKTREFEAIQDLISAARERTGLIEGATPKSGKFLVRLPKTLHAELEVEAQKEGVSLNQFVVTTLAMRVGRKKAA